MKKEVDYEKIKTPDLKKEIDYRDIKCKNTREEMIKYLILHDQEKYIYDTIKEKMKSGGYQVGIDPRNSPVIVEMGRLVDKKLAKRLNIYGSHRIWYETSVDFIH